MQKYISFRKSETGLYPCHPASTRGTLGLSSPDVRRVAMDAVVPQDVRRNRVRSSRVVLSPRRWGQVDRDAISALRPKRRNRSATVTKTPDTPGRARSSRKAIAQGVPDVSAQPDDLCALLLFSTQGCGCGLHPAFPAPSAFRGTPNCKTRTRNRAAGMLSHVSQLSSRASEPLAARSAVKCERRPGTHSHRTSFDERLEPQRVATTPACGYGSSFTCAIAH